MKVRDRAAEIKGIFYKHCKDIIYVSPEFDINESKKRTDCGTISEEIKFIDGSLLNFIEMIVNGNIHTATNILGQNLGMFDYPRKKVKLMKILSKKVGRRKKQTSLKRYCYASCHEGQSFLTVMFDLSPVTVSCHCMEAIF